MKNELTDEELLNMVIPEDRIDVESTKIPEELKDFKPCFTFD